MTRPVYSPQSPLKRIKARIKRWNTAYPEENGVKYVHHNPERGNIGDQLCSPRHYFAFYDPIPSLTVIGGGVFVEYGYRFLRKTDHKPEHCVLWGTGLSTPPEQPVTVVSELAYLDWGLRDIDRTPEESRFLPCVSCLHPMLENATKQTGTDTLLFLNADHRVTPQSEMNKIRQLAAENHWQLLLNNCTESEMSRALASCNAVITNSFHGAYWGFLSGKKVTSLGYSSKFLSLMKGLDLDTGKVVAIGRGQEELLNTLKDSENLSLSAQTLSDHVATRKAFKELNLRFADRLQKAGAFERYELKHKN